MSLFFNTLESLSFEGCAQISQYLAKEPEMSNNIDQFTITQESEDFDISLYDQYHCYEKHYSANSSVHSLIPPETSPNISRFTITKESEDFDNSLYDQYHCHEKHYSVNSSVYSPLPPETLLDLMSQFYSVNENYTNSSHANSSHANSNSAISNIAISNSANSNNANLNNATDNNITLESNNQINVGDTFISWEVAEAYLNYYTRTFECSFSGDAISNKVIDSTYQCQRLSRKVKCSWHINLTKPKLSAEVGITSILGQHNHPMLCDVDLFTPKYRRLSDDAIEHIKFYATTGNMGAKQIYPLLVSKFLDQVILKQNLYNAIKKFKSPLNNYHGDAQNMSLPANDVPSIIEPIFSELFNQMKKLIHKNSINIIQNNEEVNCDIGFLEDQLDRPQATLNYLINGVQIDDIIEIWELKNATDESNQEQIYIDIADPIVYKHRGRPPTKRIKASSETSLHYYGTNKSARNVFDSNLYVRSLDHLDNTSTSRVPLKSVNINELYNTNKVL
ncbi:2410_t:CDS:2 [Gigaspora rosea]|nr:2410_t:CDS:2 [Gigaspora rosea]